MKVWTPVFDLIAGFVIVIFAAYYLNVSTVIDRDFDQLRYNYAVEQSTEAMFRKTLKAEDLNLDYTDLAYVTIDSSDALEVFDRVMCFNYDMAPSKENFDSVNQSIACCVLASYDGYYMTDAYEDNLITNTVASDGFSIRFSPKIPYIINVNNNSYAIDAYKKTYISMNSLDHTARPYLYTSGNNLPVGVAEEDLNKVINTQIRSSIISAVENSENVSMGDLNKFRLFFPENTTVTGVNPFEVPSIFVIMASANYASTSKISAMSVSGFKVIPKINIIAFTDTKTNISYYCYESQMTDEEKTSGSGGISMGGLYGDFEIENYYDSIKEACKEVSPTTGKHYVPYYDLLSRKITKQVKTEN